MSDMDRMIDVVYRPHHYIEYIIASFVLVGGLYIGSPWYVGASGGGDVNPGLYATLITETARYFFAFLFSFPSLCILVGKWKQKKNWVRFGLYWSFIVIFFTVVLIWATNGLRPVTWLAPLMVGLISAVLWIRARWEDRIR